jgi:hypothetical protein
MTSSPEPDLPDGWDDRRVGDAYRALAAGVRSERLPVRAVVEAATAADSPRRRSAWGWGAAVAAAVLVAAIAVVPRLVAPVGPGDLATAPAAVSAAPLPSATSTPALAAGDSVPASVPILDAAGLIAIAERERAGGLEPVTVATTAEMGPAAGTPGMATDIECWPTGSCRMIGSISGAGLVAIREDDRIVEPPLPTGDAPMVLRIARSGPLEYLGQMEPASAEAPLNAATIDARTAAAVPGTVIAVRSWMNAGHEIFSAGPVPPDDEPAPFVGQVNGAWLADESFLPLTKLEDGTGTAISGSSAPAGAIQVQGGAYGQFAPNPADANEVNYASRQGLWLVRAVTYAHAGWDTMHGWLLVGRIDAAPLPAQPTGRDVAGYPTVISAQEAAAIAAGPTDGRVLLVDGAITAVFGVLCSGGPCQVGLLAGTEVKVSVDRETRAFAAPYFGEARVAAYRVSNGALEYLGYMGYAEGSTFTEDLATLAAMANPPTPDSPTGPNGPVTFVVRGWLVDQGAPIPCPTAVSGEGWPFGCGHSWITPEAYQPVKGNDPNAVAPTSGIEAAAGDYRAWAPNPAWLPNGIAHEPREGTWLVRLLTGSDGQRAWEVVARLAP